jgi:hypothetical protein
LIIVSSLARGPGPFPTRLSARASSHADPPRIEPPPQRATPRLKLAPLVPPPRLATSPPPPERTFHLLVHPGPVDAEASYAAVTARLRGVGERVQVYVDQSDISTVADATIRDVVTTFDGQVFPAAAGRFGAAVDVDGDGRLTVLFSGWLGKMAGGKVRVDGFVRGSDLDARVPAPFGNCADMIYLNSRLTAGPHLKTVLAHEYTHAITYSRKALARAGGPTGLEEEGWLDEALAHLVEDLHGFSRSNLDYRVSAFLSDPERYRLVVDDYYAADLFRSHGNRGATYLFLRWCVDVYGPGLLDLLIRSEVRGIPALEGATGSSFADLFRRWTVALFTSGLDPVETHEGGYRTVDLRGTSGDWLLAGPRASRVELGTDERWSATGTVAHFAIIPASPTGAVAIEVEAPPEARLQVTAVPLPPGLGGLELAIEAFSNPSDNVEIRARLREHDGVPLRLTALSWEPLVPTGDARTTPFPHGSLDPLGIKNTFGSTQLPTLGSLTSGAIPLGKLRASEGPLVFKVAAVDARGRKHAAWAIVEIPAFPRALGAVLDAKTP